MDRMAGGRANAAGTGALKRARIAREGLLGEESFFSGQLPVDQSADLIRKADQIVNPSLASGIVRTRWPVALKIALQIAGATGGNAGSPTPVGGNSLWIK